MVVADAGQVSRTADRAEALEATGSRALVSLPVTEQGRLVAVFYLGQSSAREWTPAEIEFARDVAERRRTAIARRRAEQVLRRVLASLEQQVEHRTAGLRASQARLRTIFETSLVFRG